MMSHTVVLRKVGGSVMLALPPALLDLVEVAAGQQVDVSVEEGRIVVEPRRRPRYTLAELLSRCDPDAPRSDEDSEWLEARPTGAELL
jgi:antitoxin ChpS